MAQSSGQTIKCQMGSCRRKVSLNSPHYPYCPDHKNYSPAFKEANRSMAGLMSSAAAAKPRLSVTSSHDGFVNDVSSFTPMDRDVASALHKSMDDLYSGTDLTVPGNAAQIDLNQLVDHLSSERGIDPSRISILHTKGLNRRVMNSWKAQRGPGIQRRALVMDHGTSHQSVVDPAISELAPVFDQNRSVEDQLPSGDTPFGDSPFVGSMEEYTDGSYLWWDQHQVVSLSGNRR